MKYNIIVMICKFIYNVRSVKKVIMMKEINVELGNKIKIARKLANVTREKLAESINVSPRFLADVEAGKVGVSIQTLYKISLNLGVTSDYLLGLTDDDQSDEQNKLINKIKNLDGKYYGVLLRMIEELEKLG